MKDDLSTWPEADLKHGYRYGRDTGIHTFGDCPQGCGYAARGGRPCWRCCRAELVRREGETVARALLGEPQP